MTGARALRGAAAPILMVAFTGGCFSLDSFVWNPRHCSAVPTDASDPICAEKLVCTPCDEPYPFARFGIDPARATQVRVAVAGGEENDNWYFAAAPDSPRRGITVIYSHGNFAGIEHYLNRIALVLQTGVNVFALDYRGFGKSSTAAEPEDEEIFVQDVLAARAAATDLVAGTVTVHYGYSAGGLSALAIATATDDCGLVLEAPWPSVQSFTNDSTFLGVPGSFVTNHSWDNFARMRRMDPDVAYLHLHGDDDATVRIELGHEMAAASPARDKEFVIIAGAGHGNLFGKDIVTELGDDAYVALLGRWLDTVRCR